LTGLAFPWKAVLIGGAVIGTGVAIVQAVKKLGPGSTTKPIGRVALIGDSYAVGLGPELDKILPEFKFEGHVGTTVSQWADRVRSACDQCGDWLTGYVPDIVLVSLGVNDGATPSRYDYVRIVNGLSKIGAKIKWIEPPAAVNTTSRAMIRSLAVPTIPGTQTPLAADGLHPKSYTQWAREIASALG